MKAVMSTDLQALLASLERREGLRLGLVRLLTAPTADGTPFEPAAPAGGRPHPVVRYKLASPTPAAR